MELENILKTISEYAPNLLSISFWVDTLLALIIGELFNYVRSKKPRLYYQLSPQVCVAHIATIDADTGHASHKYIYEQNVVVWNQGNIPVSYDEMSKVHRPSFRLPPIYKLHSSVIHSQHDEAFVNLQLFPDHENNRCEFTFDRIGKGNGFAVHILSEEEYNPRKKSKLFGQHIQCYFPHFNCKIKRFSRLFQKPNVIDLILSILFLFAIGSVLRPEFGAKGICAETIVEAVLYVICILLAYVDIRSFLVRFRMPSAIYNALIEPENPNKIRFGSFKRFADSFVYELPKHQYRIVELMDASVYPCDILESHYRQEQQLYAQKQEASVK